MKKIFAIVCVFLLLGCANKPASVTIAETAKESISAAYNTLPKECQNETVKKLLVSAQAQIDAVVVASKTEKAMLEKDIAVRNWLLAILVVLILWYFGRRLIKKLRD